MGWDRKSARNLEGVSMNDPRRRPSDDDDLDDEEDELEEEEAEAEGG